MFDGHNIKGNAQSIQATAFRFWEKNDSSDPKNIPENT